MRKAFLSRGGGPLFVAIAAFLWATDALVRLPAIDSLDPSFIVLAEHFFIVLMMLPWVSLYRAKTVHHLKPRQWAAIAVTGAGASAVATVLFTESFKTVNPSVAILLQKIQPVLVVLIAFFFLGEKPRRHFYSWAALALAAGLVLSFPDLDFGFLRARTPDAIAHARGVFFATLAALIWALATVIGRALLLKLDVGVVLFWRFAFGFLLLIIWVGLARAGIPQVLYAHPGLVAGLLYMAIFPGLLAMGFYYAGLARTPASITTFVELIFPVSAVLLNTIVLKLPLNGIQIVAGLALLAAVTKITSPEGGNARS